jgi:hemerythrin-like domain-containing protein
MLPIGMLMKEHRLTEKMMDLLRREQDTLSRSEYHASEIDRFLDFFQTYVDKMHHAKEEKILFSRMIEKDIQAPHRQLIDLFIDEHNQARKLIEKIAAANKRGYKGNSALQEIAGSMSSLVKLYTGHIEREDKEFFFPSTQYFNKNEQNNMLQLFDEIDMGVLHDKYETMVAQMESDPKWLASAAG